MLIMVRLRRRLVSLRRNLPVRENFEVVDLNRDGRERGQPEEDLIKRVLRVDLQKKLHRCE